METISIILIVLASVAVIGVLVMGLYSMVRGGEYAKKHGNKFMQYRVYLQGLALALLALAYFSAQG
ncbi:MAG: twin transmembrane helix small protein [Alphaproteobacteria bacterium]